MLWKHTISKPSGINRQAMSFGYACVLLGFYLFAFLIPQGTLPHLHSRTDLHAGDSCKKDACHLAIFHPGDKGGCHHKFHLTQAEDQCPLCNWSFTQQVQPSATVLPVLVRHPHAAKDYTPPATVDPSRILHADRGPPAA